ncbi:MAG: 2'-5' RNA ligase [Candidatus Omnitrophica bacterium 4484_171]|nr:MAG: 2'-5' RNA ligase [Candidatus Omnitrophica bacterium 4484_171]
MRTFIAIPLPQDIKNYLNSIQAQLKECDVYAKWVNIHNVHMTLKFLGETEEDKIPSIENTINKSTAGLHLLKVNLINFGFFPNERNPRVFFISTDEERTLQKIAYKLEKNLEPLGFNPEYRFRSHITLARLKGKRNIACLAAKSKEIKLDKPFHIKSIILYKSTLTPKGPIYEEIFKAKL